MTTREQSIDHGLERAILGTDEADIDDSATALGHPRKTSRHRLSRTAHSFARKTSAAYSVAPGRHTVTEPPSPTRSDAIAVPCSDIRTASSAGEILRE
jgi:hypothetical protein